MVSLSGANDMYSWKQTDGTETCNQASLQNTRFLNVKMYNCSLMGALPQKTRKMSNGFGIKGSLRSPHSSSSSPLSSTAPRSPAPLTSSFHVPRPHAIGILPWSWDFSVRVPLPNKLKKWLKGTPFAIFLLV